MLHTIVAEEPLKFTTRDTLCQQCGKVLIVNPDIEDGPPWCSKCCTEREKAMTPRLYFMDRLLLKLLPKARYEHKRSPRGSFDPYVGEQYSFAVLGIRVEVSSFIVFHMRVTLGRGKERFYNEDSFMWKTAGVLLFDLFSKEHVVWEHNQHLLQGDYRDLSYYE